MNSRPTSSRSLSSRVGLYGLVGVVAAAVHAGVLLGLGVLMPVWLANPLAFLAASIAGYLGHARVTFRPETGGERFARRWLLLQYGVNLAVCSLLPLVIGGLLPPPLELVVLVFTPTVLNALIWSRAARFSLQRRSGQLNPNAPRPRLHADDLGLSDATNRAILQLAQAGRLDGASLLVNGPAAASGVAGWSALEAERPDLQLCLHLCLTEGPAAAPAATIPDLVDARGHLRLSFGRWLLASLGPPRQQRRIAEQLGREIEAQIARFRQLCGPGPIHLDGHQHIHLVPLVLNTLLAMADREQIVWLRSTEEPLPTGLPLRCWWEAWRQAGLLKWLVLQLLSQRARRPMRRHGLSSNRSFAGVLFTGQMAGAPLNAAWRELQHLAGEGQAGETAPLLLAHPGAPLDTDLKALGFAVSQPFAASSWRQREWRALQAL
jgi:chitin disaccharide deacetylase